MDKLVDVKQGVRVGIRPDEAYADETVWADGRNVVFSSGSVRPTLSQHYLLTQGTKRPVTGMQEILIDGDKCLFWGSGANLWYYKEGDEVANANISGTSDYELSRQELWHTVNWKSTVIFTASTAAATKGTPQYWDPGSELFVEIDLSLAPFDLAELVSVLKVHLLFANTDIDPTSIFWCSADDITDWEPLATNSARGLYIRSLKSPIITIVPYQEVLGVYGTKSLYALSYIGAPDYFTYTGPILEGIGAVGKHAVVAAGRKHYGMSDDGIWETDGFDYRYLDEGFVHRTVFNDINKNLLSIVVAWHNIAETMVVFFWPSSNATELDSGVGYNYVTGAWTRFDYARTARTHKHVFTKALLGDANGNIWQQEEKGGLVVPPPTTGDPVNPAMEVLYNAECGYGGLSYGSGGYGYLWGYDEDGNVLGPQ
jgi:hypothetical protein